jgi:flagellar hook protein FlgE
MDSQGYIVTNSGARLQGFMADSTGQLTKVPTDMKLSVDGVSPKQTSEADISLNLDSRTAVPTSSFSITDPTSYSGVSSMTVYSGQGQSHTLGMYFVKSAANTWNVQASLDGTLFPNNPAMTLHFDSAGKITSPSGPVTLAVPVPASEGGPMNIAMNVGQVTQFGSAFAIADQAQNGYGAGDLAGFSIGNDGTVQARYSNGHTVTQGQITLVNFRNPQGLNPLGGNVWTESAASGSPLTPQAPGTGSLGPVQSGALEQSNVDLTGELVNMITAQRVYQANAQTIKAEDTLLQTIVNLR